MQLNFVHIPKTAGTSFRLGAERYFGKARIVYDYGKESNETSQVSLDHLYGDVVDLWAFANACQDDGAAMVGGHVHISRFVSVLGVGNTVTFLRDPIQRMASEYSHFVRNYSYKGSFYDFYSRPVMHNRLSKLLNGVDIEAIGVLGLTECYSESLALINHRYGIDIPPREDNRGKPSLEVAHELSAEDEEELKRLNARDIHLFQRAQSLFDTRLQMFDQNKVFAHARLVECSPQRVAGWAWWGDLSDTPVEVELWLNGKHVTTITAVDARPNLCRLRPPRGGYVGFHFSRKFKAGDKVQCRVASTGQWFPSKPRRVVEPSNK